MHSFGFCITLPPHFISPTLILSHNILPAPPPHLLFHLASLCTHPLRYTVANPTRILSDLDSSINIVLHIVVSSLHADLGAVVDFESEQWRLT